MLKSKIYNILKVNLAACDALYYTVKEVAVKPWTHFCHNPCKMTRFTFNLIHQILLYEFSKLDGS